MVFQYCYSPWDATSSHWHVQANALSGCRVHAKGSAVYRDDGVKHHKRRKAFYSRVMQKESHRNPNPTPVVLRCPPAPTPYSPAPENMPPCNLAMPRATHTPYFSLLTFSGSERSS